MKKCIEYLRKSQFDRDFSELSIEETLAKHEMALSAFVEKTDYVVTEILKEVVSGETLAQRPQMQLLLDKVNTGDYYGVIVKDIDRLSRGDNIDSGYIMQVLKINNCRIITPDKVYDLNDDQDETFTDMKFMFSRFELKTIRKRLMIGKDTAVKQGLYVGSNRPYGYERIKLKGEKGYTLKPVPAEAEIVKLIFDMYVNKNMGYKNIAYELQRIDTSRKWTKQSVNGIIINPIHAGYIRWGYVHTEKIIKDGKIKTVKKHNDPDTVPRYKGRHDPIISPELFEKAEAIRKNRIHPSVKKHRPLHDPFAGILRCEKCDGAIRIHRPAKDRKNQTERYDCVNTKCDCRSTISPIIEEAILSELKSWLAGYSVTVEAPTAITDYQSLLDNAEAKLKDLTDKQNKLCEYLETGIYTPTVFATRNAVYEKNIADVTDSIIQLRKSISEQNKRISDNAQIVPTVKHILDDYDKLDVETKNRLLKMVVKKITYYRKRGGDEISVKIYPLLPSSM